MREPADDLKSQAVTRKLPRNHFKNIVQTYAIRLFFEQFFSHGGWCHHKAHRLNALPDPSPISQERIQIQSPRRCREQPTITGHCAKTRRPFEILLFSHRCIPALLDTFRLPVLPRWRLWFEERDEGTVQKAHLAAAGLRAHQQGAQLRHCRCRPPRPLFCIAARAEESGLPESVLPEAKERFQLLASGRHLLRIALLVSCPLLWPRARLRSAPFVRDQQHRLCQVQAKKELLGRHRHDCMRHAELLCRKPILF
mmetsp:Transcript_39030/g.81919  ORF Transcript_39030/g.81919 Transcript_39030/m.81919 type:complete len:254 (+) Transcript_39030:116-877(+)